MRDPERERGRFVMELQLSLDGRAQIFFVVKVSRGRQSKLLGRLVKNVDVQPATTNGILMNGISRRLQKKKTHREGVSYVT